MKVMPIVVILLSLAILASSLIFGWISIGGLFVVLGIYFIGEKLENN